MIDQLQKISELFYVFLFKNQYLFSLKQNVIKLLQIKTWAQSVFFFLLVFLFYIVYFSQSTQRSLAERFLEYLPIMLLITTDNPGQNFQDQVVLRVYIQFIIQMKIVLKLKGSIIINNQTRETGNQGQQSLMIQT